MALTSLWPTVGSSACTYSRLDLFSPHSLIWRSLSMTWSRQRQLFHLGGLDGRLRFYGLALQLRLSHKIRLQHHRVGVG
jgi:hypothetical protein